MDIRFIDLFAGIGGIRKGLEQAIIAQGDTPICVFTSEIKEYAVNILRQNNPNEHITGDITQVKAEDIPPFDILCAGFPCQAFSSAGKRDGFADTRGTMFFEVERIIKHHHPSGFILENVEGLVNHDKGKTLKVIVGNLKQLGYTVTYKVLNAKDFGVPQDRKRIYIVGNNCGNKISLDDFPVVSSKVGEILQNGLPTSNTPFVQRLLSLYSVEQLEGKSIKDKRGGSGNIHSWDLELKGALTSEQKKLMNKIMTERRKKKWAEQWQIKWMDGMPLTISMIREFYNAEDLQAMLDDLMKKKYLKFEYPKDEVTITNENGIPVKRRAYNKKKSKGYNIVAGKLSFEVNKILGKNEIAPTLVATDVDKIHVIDGAGLRKLSLREGLRLFGYPEDFRFNDIAEKDGFDLLGNTVVVPVIKRVAERMLKSINL